MRAATPETRVGAPRRRGGGSAWLILVLALGAVLIAVVVIWRPWRPAALGPADTITPPAPALDGLEISLVNSIGRHTKTVGEQPVSAEAWGELGGVFDVHAMLAEAIVCYEQAERIDSDDFRWPYFLGHCRQIGDQQAALEAFVRAAERDPDYAPVHVYIGRGRLLTDDLAGAEEHFAKAAAIDPDLVRGHLGLAQVDVARDDAAAALVHLEKALALGPVAAEVYQLAAQVHETLGDSTAAASFRDQAVGRAALEPLPDPMRDDLKWEKGVTLPFRRQRSERYMEAGRSELAVAEWNAALADDPELAEAHGQLGLVYAASGKRKEAIASLQRSLEINRLDHSIRNSLGGLLIEDGRTEEGLEQMRQSCRFMPDNADAHFNLAQALRRARKMKEAEEVFTQTLQIDGEHVRARFERGTLFGQMGRYEEAAADFREVARLDPSRRGAFTNLARALYGLQRYTEAIEAVRWGLESMPGDIRLRVDLAWRLATCPDPAGRDAAEALALAEPLCLETQYRDATMIETLAAAHAANGNFSDAAQFAETAVTMAMAQMEAAPNGALAQRILQMKARRDLYRERKPFVEEG